MARQLQREIEGMELRKNALITSVQGEITAAKQREASEFFNIGLDVYNAHLSGESADDKLAAHYDTLAEIRNLISEREAKMTEIANRYDEEIGMLRTQINAPPPPPQAPAPAYAPQPPQPGASIFPQPAPVSSSRAFCEKCGAAYTPGADMFCSGCGARLG
jgi:hypothetical protein